MTQAMEGNVFYSALEDFPHRFGFIGIKSGGLQGLWGTFAGLFKEKGPYFDHLRDFEHHPRKAFGSGLQGFYMGYRSLQKPHDVGRQVQI